MLLSIRNLSLAREVTLTGVDLADGIATGETIPPGSELIEIHLAELNFLFNAMDHSPLPERDLDPKAEEFIVSSAREARGDDAFALQVYVDRYGASEDTSAVPGAVHEFFAQRSLDARRRL